MGNVLRVPSSPSTTVIIPTYNEADNIRKTIDSIHSQKTHPVQVIVADGYSSDNTVPLARRAGAQVIRVRGGRAAQLNAAAKRARAPHLLFLHADTVLPPAFDVDSKRILMHPRVVAGAFCLRIGAPGFGLRVVEQVANWRSSFLQRPYGDQVLFMSAHTFNDIGTFPNMPFLEDYEMARRLARRGRIALSKKCVVTSARRWNTLGVLRTTLLNRVIIAAYHLGVPVPKLQSWYRGALKRAMASNAENFLKQ